MEELVEIRTGSRSVTGAQLAEQVRAAANGFLALGVLKGECVAILMRNDLPQVVAMLAAQSLGAYPVQVNWHSQADEIGYVLRDCNARVLVAHSDLLQRCADVVAPELSLIGAIPPKDIADAYKLSAQQRRLSGRVIEWESWLASQPSGDPLSAPAVDSIIYTSGTTGRPKGVRRFVATSLQQEMTERMRMSVFGIGAGARVLVPAPLYHTAPNLFALRAVRKAELLLLPARFDPEELLAQVERYRITHLYVVPTIFVRLLNLPKQVRQAYDLGSLSFVLHAGGPCARTVKQAMLAWWGPIIHEYYGSTETGPNTFVRGDEWQRKPGTIGRAIEGVRVEVRDDQGQSLPDGEVGELCVWNEGYADFTYLNRPEARAELENGGLIMSGDLGYRDADGYYFLCDRKRDLVISGGVNIYPAEVEAALQAMDGVLDCAVFGIPHEEYGEALAAVVQPQPGRVLNRSAIKEFLSARLASFKLPTVIDFTTDLPREESGKIKKRLLREPYWLNSDRKI